MALKVKKDLSKDNLLILKYWFDADTSWTPSQANADFFTDQNHPIIVEKLISRITLAYKLIITCGANDQTLKFALATQTGNNPNPHGFYWQKPTIKANTISTFTELQTYNLLTDYLHFKLRGVNITDITFSSDSWLYLAVSLL